MILECACTHHNPLCPSRWVLSLFLRGGAWLRPHCASGHLGSWMPTHCRGAAVRVAAAAKEDWPHKANTNLVEQVGYHHLFLPKCGDVCFCTPPCVSSDVLLCLLVVLWLRCCTTIMLLFTGAFFCCVSSRVFSPCTPPRMCVTCYQTSY